MSSLKKQEKALFFSLLAFFFLFPACLVRVPDQRFKEMNANLKRVEKEGKTALDEAKTYINKLNNKVERISYSLLKLYEMVGNENFYANAKRSLWAFGKMMDLGSEDPEVWIKYGILLSRKADSQSALKAYDKAIEFAHQKNALLESKALNLQGEVYYSRGDYVSAENLFVKAYKLYHANADKRGTAEALSAWGKALLSKTKKPLDEQAMKKYFESLRIFVEIGDMAGEADVYCNLGNAYLEAGNLEAAEASYSRSYDLENGLPSRRPIFLAAIIGNLGNLYRIKNQLKKAETLLKESLQINSETDCVEGKARDSGNLGVVYLRMEKVDEAYDLFTTCLSLSNVLGAKEQVVWAEKMLATTKKFKREQEDGW